MWHHSMMRSWWNCLTWLAIGVQCHPKTPWRRLPWYSSLHKYETDHQQMIDGINDIAYILPRLWWVTPLSSLTLTITMDHQRSRVNKIPVLSWFAAQYSNTILVRSGGAGDGTEKDWSLVAKKVKENPEISCGRGTWHNDWLEKPHTHRVW